MSHDANSLRGRYEGQVEISSLGQAQPDEVLVSNMSKASENKALQQSGEVDILSIGV
jgi:hypothetical protein